MLVSGYDHIGQNSPRSIVGASWVFPLADLDKLGAFLAIRMNGESVPADHGKPRPTRRARLVRMLVDQVGQRNPSRRAGRTRDVTDGGVRGTHAPEPTAQVRARLRARRHPDRRHPGARREAQGPQRPRISHRRHRLGRHQARRSTADPLWQRSAVHAFLRCVRCRRRTRCGPCGNTAGSPRSQASTTSRSKSPINRFRSDASSRSITCGRSESRKSEQESTKFHSSRFHSSMVSF